MKKSQFTDVNYLKRVNKEFETTIFDSENVLN